MKAFLLFFIVFPPVIFASTVEERRATPDYFVTYENGGSITTGQAKVTVKLDYPQVTGGKSLELQYGMNGSSEKMIVGLYGKTFLATPKKYVFQFYHNSGYNEITTDSIEVKSGMNTVITLHFLPSGPQHLVFKPVIYLYPETATDVSVEVKPVGNFTFTYPAYNGEWKVNARPNGDLLIGGKDYPYLFWEAEQRVNNPFADGTGFIVSKEQVSPFLEEKLTAMGLNTKEQTDFITFWGPRLAAHDRCSVKFLLNEECDAFAALTITPKPDRVNRVFIVWSELTDEITLAGQQLSVLNRDGFDVLEWGGSQLPPLSITKNDKP